MTSDNCPSRSLSVVEADAVPASIAPDLQDAAAYAQASKSAATRRAYQSDFSIFRGWCKSKGVHALPATADTVAAFLAFEANRGSRAATIGRRWRPFAMRIVWSV